MRLLNQITVARLGHIFAGAAAFVALVSVVTACSGGSPCERDDPADALRYFFAAADAQRTDLVWECLSDDSRAMLSANAGHYNGAGVERREPHEMIRFGHVMSSTREYRKLETVTRDETGATIRVVRHDESSFDVELERQHGRWAIGLPLADRERNL